MTLLSVVQNACNELGISSPSTVIGNADSQIKQLLALSNREGKALAARPAAGWERLLEEATFNTQAQESQGTIESLAPGYKYLINQTIWNRTQQREVYGVISPQEWQRLKATETTGVFDHFRINGGEMLFYPVPTAGEAIYFEFMSRNWCESSGGTGQQVWSDDTDVGRIDEELLTLGLIWRWKAMKGFSYQEEFNEYERQVADAIARDGTKAILNAAANSTTVRPYLNIPDTGYL